MTFGTDNQLTSGTTDDSIWQIWIRDSSQITTASAVSVNNQIWQSWITDTGTAATVNSQARIWQFWCQGTYASNVVSFNSGRSQRELTPEEEAEQKILNDWDNALYENQRRKIAIAAKKAERLLHRELTEAQKKDLMERKHFFVRSRSGRLYKVKYGKTHNVVIVDPVSFQELLELCVTAENGHELPEYDVMLAQKLWVEIHEADMLRKANIWDLRNNRRQLLSTEKEQLAAAA